MEGIRAKGGKAIGLVADVCSKEDTERVFTKTLREFGDLDILINNAAVGEQKLIDETDDEWIPGPSAGRTANTADSPTFDLVDKSVFYLLFSCLWENHIYTKNSGVL